eukprot:CAMPEP_0171491992 /NCGR_PEP_ID=MMETSP0958-20121227/4164_1 /TAXON_ID=87120 /ORGANISM="Aurantiochytrium limacinum, Strain ATCCMYA-1381" /LENGTH=302 /DNA_ID=CAMNT_0012025465 /DNA_START=301 /DNA_END=1205 /DNA_ORIENTATION=-
MSAPPISSQSSSSSTSSSSSFSSGRGLALAVAASAATALLLGISVHQIHKRSKKRTRQDSLGYAHEIVVLGGGEAGFEVVRQLRARVDAFQDRLGHLDLQVVMVNNTTPPHWLWRLFWDRQASPDRILIGDVCCVNSDSLVLSSGRVVDFDVLVCADALSSASDVEEATIDKPIDNSTKTTISTRPRRSSSLQISAQNLTAKLCSYVHDFEMDEPHDDSIGDIGDLSDSSAPSSPHSHDTVLPCPSEWCKRGRRGLDVEPGSFRVRSTPHVFAMGAAADIPPHTLWPNDVNVQAQAIASGVL